MSYDEVKKDFVKEKFWLIEIDLDYCDNTYGDSPCAAAVGVTGTQKCFNTARSCQDRDNYAQSPKTYSFCTKRSPVPFGLGAIPSLKAAPTISGATIDTSGGLGVRGSITCNFIDHPHSDIDVDKYVDERTYIPYETGSFWGKFRARNPYYNNRILRAYSGYIVDGVFSKDNAQVRTYVIENITVNRGVATVVAKDVLKLADDDRAVYPEVSTGELTDDILSTDTEIVLSPADIGDDEYPSDGFVRVGDEVMAFTRIADTLTITRGEYTTIADDHSSGDTVQICKYFNDRVDVIVNELLTLSSAAVDPAFIPLTDWAIEASENYPYLLEALITESTGVKTLLTELGNNAPHFLYLDDRTQLINFVAVKEPPVNVNVLNNQQHIMSGLTVKDMPDSRLSDVIVYFGQKDPTQKLDEFSNYSQTYIRSDLASASDEEFGSRKIESIYSRWINNFNKAAAVELTARKGRRFGITPRQIGFKLTAKDSENWLGDNVGIDHPVLQGFTGENESTTFQITSVKEAGDFQYTALEYLYADPLPDDPDSGVNLVILGGSENNINLRTVYDLLFDAPTDETVVKFTIDTNVEIGSTSTSTYSIETGSWPVGMEAIRIQVKGLAAGRGGDGSYTDGLDGGSCLLMEHDVTIDDISGLLGGGGGSGGGGYDGLGSVEEEIISGGGAGVENSLPYGGSATGGVNPGSFDYNPGKGGDLGEDGEGVPVDAGGFNNGGLAGTAINTNGYTLTVSSGSANIKGAII